MSGSTLGAAAFYPKENELYADSKEKSEAVNQVHNAILPLR